MATRYYKILLFLKRRPGMTFAAFQDYYENHHVPLCLKYASGMTRYVRRFVTPHPHVEKSTNEELPFDVITELWFEDETVFRGTVRYLTAGSLPDEIIEDEKRLFDREKTRIATAIECETVLTK